jgi:hypothetical protein
MVNAFQMVSLVIFILIALQLILVIRHVIKYRKMPVLKRNTAIRIAVYVIVAIIGFSLAIIWMGNGGLRQRPSVWKAMSGAGKYAEQKYGEANNITCTEEEYNLQDTINISGYYKIKVDFNDRTIIIKANFNRYKENKTYTFEVADTTT